MTLWGRSLVIAGLAFLLATAGCGGGDDPDPGSGGTGGGSPAREICDNGVDDDGDGAVDCADSDCAAEPACLCGNGVLDAGEACDGAELGGKSCESEGFEAGALGCTGACELDTSACTRQEICDNGVDDDGDGDADCADPDCATDPACLCGNGVLDAGEECDGTDLDGKSCESLGFESGELTCTAACELDESGCRYPDEICDNGIDDDRDGDIDCDDSDCASTSLCLCGNGILDAGEECDGDLFGGKSCETLDYNAGELACNDDCTVDASDCRLVEICDNGVDDDGDGDVDCRDSDCVEAETCNVCGDDRADPEEDCDGTDHAGETCETLGFLGGTLACVGCAFDTSACFTEEVCTGGLDEDGDGAIDCDDSDCDGDPNCIPGAFCHSAIPVTGDDTGTTIDGPSEFDGSCGTPGRERIFAFTPGVAGEVGNLHVELFPSGNLAFHLRTACDDPATELACVNEHADNSPESIDLMVQGGMPIYIIVDSPNESTAYDFRLEVAYDPCGNGVVAGYEECDPPDGETCGDNCVFIEADCSDFLDNDQDGLFDCQDPTNCQGVDPVCTPGTGAVGSACTAHSDCASVAGDDPICWSEAGQGYPSGLCSEACDLTTPDCPAGSTCVDVGRNNGTGACYPTCTVSTDCPNDGYRCAVPEGGVVAICLPACTSDDHCPTTGRCKVTEGVCVDGEVCGNGIDDDGDGDADCDDPDCDDHWFCLPAETDCMNFVDDDNDGLIDCRDPTACGSTAACVPGTGAVGSPCTAPSDCASLLGDDPACIPASAGTFARGYCTELCDFEVGGCPAGTECVDRGIALQQSLPESPVGVCMKTCTTAMDCGPGWTCGAVPPDTTALCVPMEICDNDFDDDFDGDFDCWDSECASHPSCQIDCPGAIEAQEVNAGTTVGGTSENSSEMCYFGGWFTEEAIYYYSPRLPRTTGTLVITLDSDTDHGIYVRTDCYDSDSEIACVDDEWLDPEVLVLENFDGGQTIFVYVEAIDWGEEGDFTLTFDYSACGDGVVDPSEDCDDGNTDDGDACPSTCQFARESEPNDSFYTADPYGQGFSGRVYADTYSWTFDVDYVSFEVPGPSSTVEVEITDGGSGACLNGTQDTKLTVYAPDRTPLGDNDDISDRDLCSRVDLAGLPAGTYYAKIEAGAAVVWSHVDYHLEVRIH